MTRSVRARVLLSLTVLLTVGSQRTPTAQTTATLPHFEDSVVLRGLVLPTAVRFSPDGRVFVAEKSGLVKVFDSLSDTAPSVFADLRTSVHNYWDRGLLGLGLDPDFPTSPYVYVLYTRDAPIGGITPRWGTPGATSDGCPDPPGGTTNGCVASGRLSRLRAAGNIMTGSELVLVDGWFQQFPSHSVGSIAFGPDGALYASGGDAASWQFVDYGQAGDPRNPAGDPPTGIGSLQTPPTAEGGALRSQDLRTSGDPVGLNGTVIRVNRTTGAAMPDNPLAGAGNANARRIVAYGLRNPFRIAVRPGTNEVWVGDVGWHAREEINRIEQPTTRLWNFGWPCYEGVARQPGYDAANLNLCERLYEEPGAVSFPRFAYRQGAAVVSGEACGTADSSVSGLAFYEGGVYPAEYDGALFFADYSRRCIWVMFSGPDGVPTPLRRATFIAPAATPVDLQIGPDGDLFYVDITGGTIHRVQYFEGNRPPRAVVTATPQSGPVPLGVSFDASASLDPDGTTSLAFSWDLDGNGTFGDSTSVRPTRTYAAAGTHMVRVRVTDAGGLSNLASVVITAGNTTPVPTITSPMPTLRWRVGDSIAFSGRGIDAEDGALRAAALTWAVVMHHCSSPASCYEHFVQSFAGVSNGTFNAPDHEYPSYLELRLTARDSANLSRTTRVRLNPQTVVETLTSSPVGLRIGVGSQLLTTPLSQTMIVGARTSVSAPSPQSLGGRSFAFASWSDGGAQTHMILAGASATTFTTTFRPVATAVSEAVLYASQAPVRRGAWTVVADATAAGGARLQHPDRGAAKRLAPSANPTDYFELTVPVRANTAYRLWLRGRAQANSYLNDSVYVQFSSAVTSTGAPVYGIGSTGATTVVIENCHGCGLARWGWQDNGYGPGVLGPVIRFATTGPQTIRIQTREDGIAIDQIVLSSQTYLTRAPGAARSDTTVLAPNP